MLYDDSEQLEVRHVISLTHHSIDLYGGGDPLSEGDLWIKRNCIRLIRKPSAGKDAQLSKPFYFFSDNCSEKEDFYHTLLLYQSAAHEPDAPPRPRQFDTQHMIKLVQQLHRPEADPHSRWLNAIIGRIFLAMYRTDDIENFIRAKINRKISRVPKPNFINSIQIQDIDMGDSGPVISNPKLKELNVNGDMTIELDIKYNGGFKLQMGAVARIDLGSRLKAREVNLIMAGTLRKLSGHMLIKIKPPPSNRMWLTFETMPHIEMSIEPVVSSRQITYGVILRAIESRIREVMGETIVLPNWDDSPFLDTSRKKFRGGIYKNNATTDHDAKSKAKEAEDHALETAVNELANAADSDTEDPGSSALKDTRLKTLSMPSLVEPLQKVSLRKAARKSAVSLAGDNTATSTSISAPGSSTPAPTTTSPPLSARKPKNLRSNSFASAATPLVSTEGANIEAFRSDARNKRSSKGAFDLVKEVKNRSQSQMSSPTALEAESEADDVPPLDMERDVLLETPEEYTEGDVSSKLTESDTRISESLRRLSLPTTPGKEMDDPGFPTPRSPSIPLPTTRSPSMSSSSRSASQSLPPPTASHLSTAANAARKWGLQVLNRQSTNVSSSSSTASFSFPKSTKNPSTAASLHSTASTASLPGQHMQSSPERARGEPMGRGQPLPPPGVPLPGPPGQKSLWSTSHLNLGMGGLKRKPVAGPPALPPRRDSSGKKIPPPLPARNEAATQASDTRMGEAPSEAHVGQDRPHSSRDDDSMLVVAAPDDDDGSSLPVSPLAERLDDTEFTPQMDGIDGSTTSKPTVASVAPEVSLPDYEQSEQASHDAENNKQSSHHEANKDLDVLNLGTDAKSTETIKARTSVEDFAKAGESSTDTTEAKEHLDEAFDLSSAAQWQREHEEDNPIATGHSHQPLV